MTTMFTKAALGAALIASAAMAATPAEARDRYGRSHDRTGTAIVAGVAGLAIGAALASGGRRGDYYYNDGYYDRGYRAAITIRGSRITITDHTRAVITTTTTTGAIAITTATSANIAGGIANTAAGTEAPPARPWTAPCAPPKARGPWAKRRRRWTA